MPATKDLYVERRLTEVSIAYKNANYIADQALPIVGVPDISGKILEEDKSALQANASGDDVIAQGQYPGVIKLEVQDKAYVTRERAVSAFLHQDEVRADEAQGRPYAPRIRKTNLATERLLLNREVRVSTLLTTTTNWASNHNASPSNKWDASSSDPVGDVLTAILKVKADLGMPPNTGIIPWEVAVKLTNNSSIKALVNGGATFANPAIDQSMEAMAALMRRIFGLQNILIPAAGKVSGNMAAGFKDAGTTPVWGDNVVIMYQPPTPMKEAPAAGYTFVWENAFADAQGAVANDRGIVVTVEPDARARGEFITARTYSDEKVLIDDAGYVLTDVLT